ncbi:MAG: hypothetical protein RPU13_13440 [Candidatus Sedimenticola sp. (ex Thyasira tokunagai)]
MKREYQKNHRKGSELMELFMNRKELNWAAGVARAKRTVSRFLTGGCEDYGKEVLSLRCGQSSFLNCSTCENRKTEELSAEIGSKWKRELAELLSFNSVESPAAKAFFLSGGEAR